MRAPTSRDRDQRSTDREFRRLVRQLQPSSPVTRHWRTGPTDARDSRITGHEDRRYAPVVAAAAGALALALAGIVIGQTSLAVVVALAGLALCSALGHDQVRTHLTVTDDGRVVVGNGVHRRNATVPAVAVARVTLPRLRRSRWSLQRPAGQLLLHSGEVLPVRALAYDPACGGDHARAAALLRTTLRALGEAGAALETRRV